MQGRIPIFEPGLEDLVLRNLEAGQEKPLRMIKVLEHACGRKAELQMLPMQPGDVPATYADISAIARDTGYAPTTPIGVGGAEVRGLVPGLYWDLIL